MSFITGAGGAIAGALGNILDEALAFVAIFSTSAMAETLLYGVHLILFCTCMFLLLRNRRSTQWFISISAVVMFVVSTVDIAITFRIISYFVPRLAEPEIVGTLTQLVHAKNSIFVANNFMAELILLYRCWMVWGRSKHVLAGCSLLVLADTIWGFLGVGPTIQILAPVPNKFIPVYIWSILAINIVLTLVAVGRIFWISRTAKRLVGQKQSVYHTAIAILVESSLIYSICILLYVLLPSSNPYRVAVLLMAMRVVAIMPTLLIVQVGLGSVVKEINLTTPMTTSRFEVRPSSVLLDTIRSSMHHEDQHPETVFRASLRDEEAVVVSSQAVELTNVSKSKRATFEDRRPRTLDYANHAATQ